MFPVWFSTICILLQKLTRKTEAKNERPTRKINEAPTVRKLKRSANIPQTHKSSLKRITFPIALNFLFCALPYTHSNDHTRSFAIFVVVVVTLYFVTNSNLFVKNGIFVDYFVNVRACVNSPVVVLKTYKIIVQFEI